MRSIKLFGIAAATVALSFGGEVQAQNGPFQFFPLSPCRLVDTRCPGPAFCTGVPQGGPVLVHNTPRNVTVRGNCGVPSDAKAVAVNATVVLPTNSGHLILYPADLGSPPTVSTLNFAGNDVIPNGAVVPLQATGTPDLKAFAFVNGNGNTNFILDVNGYFK